MIDSLGLDAAVEVGIAAFCAGEKPPHDSEVEDRLTGAGVEPWLAERLMYFLPMAYVRRLMPEAAIPDTVITPGARVRLPAEPVFTAALRRAQRAGRGELKRIALHSAEANGINQLLNRGSQLKNIVLVETALVTDLEPPRRGDGGVPSPLAAFDAALRDHGVRLGRKTKIDASLIVELSPSGVVGTQVDFAVSHPALAVPWLKQSFSGHGATYREAVGQAVHKFELGALHTFIEGLLSPGSAADQVERERYEHPGGAFELVSSTQLVLPTGQPVPEAGPPVDQLLEALRAEPLTPEVHGLGVYLRYQDGRPRIAEVLLDNQPWPAGEAVAAAAPAPLPDGEVTMRAFGLLVPPQKSTRRWAPKVLSHRFK